MIDLRIHKPRSDAFSRNCNRGPGPGHNYWSYNIFIGLMILKIDAIINYHYVYIYISFQLTWPILLKK